MPLSRARRDELAAMSLPTDTEMQERVRDFVLRSGLQQSELAETIGFSEVSLRMFMKGTYAKFPAPGRTCDAPNVTANIKAALKAFMDMHDVQHEMRLVGDHYATNDYKKVREASLKALADGKLYVIDGPPGTQKTWSLLNVKREIESQGLGRVVYVYCRVDHTKLTFLREICRAAGVPARGDIDSLLRKLQFFLSGQRTLLLIDEGQHLAVSGLEVLRQLLDLPPYFGAVIGGSHELGQRVQHWQMEQWRSRTQATLLLNGPGTPEARAILAKQLGITDRAEADHIIQNCEAVAHRHDGERNRRFTYTSARLLFGFIQGMKDAQAAALSQECAA